MYSDEYEHGAVLTNRVIENIFEQEIMQVRKPKTFMRIWQMFALSSVMRRPIFSVYPKRGNPVVRKDLHRKIEPREKISNNPLYIMWTTTRYDMTNTYWAPNHFVPVLQMQEQTSTGHVETINADEWQESETHTNEKFDEPAVRLKDDETVEGIQDTCNNYDDPENRSNQTSYGIIEPDDENINTSENSTQDKKDIPTEAPECIGKYVIVDYDSTPYPGYVEDGDSSDIFVVCMHRVYKKVERNVFFWPTSVKDRCWYRHDQILAMIPEPKKIKGSSEHFEVDPDIWCKVLEKV